MSALAKNTKATVIPCLRYRDTAKAIDWLCDAFGFEKQAVYPNSDGTIAHAQLAFGNGMIMLGSVLKHETEWGRLIKQPDEIGGAETQSAYVIVADTDVIYTRAKAAGAKIIVEIKDEIMAGAVSAATIWKVISGTLAHTPGDLQHRAPSMTARCAWRYAVKFTR